VSAEADHRVEAYRDDMIQTVREVGTQTALTFDLDWKDAAAEATRELAGSGETFNAEDVRHLAGDPSSPNAMGAAFQTDRQFLNRGGDVWRVVGTRDRGVRWLTCEILSDKAAGTDHAGARTSLCLSATLSNPISVVAPRDTKLIQHRRHGPRAPRRRAIRSRMC